MLSARTFAKIHVMVVKSDLLRIYSEGRCLRHTLFKYVAIERNCLGVYAKRDSADNKVVQNPW